MKAFIIISLFFLSVLSLFSYNKIELVEKIEDFRIESTLTGFNRYYYDPSKEKSDCMINDSIVVIYYHQSTDTTIIKKGVNADSAVKLANYNIKSKKLEFFYDGQDSVISGVYYDNTFLSKDKSKLISANPFYRFFAPDDDVYNDTISIYNTSNGHIDTLFGIYGYKFKKFHNMYNGNVSFIAIKPNTTDTNYFEFEQYIGELDLSDYSYTLTKTNRELEKKGEINYIEDARIVKSHRPGIEKEVFLEVDEVTYYEDPWTWGHPVVEKHYNYIVSYSLDDSLQYKKSGSSLWWWGQIGEETRSIEGWYLHQDSCIMGTSSWLTNYYLDPFEPESRNRRIQLDSRPIGVDENNHYIFINNAIEWKADSTQDYIKIYDYKNNNIVDSINVGLTCHHPIFGCRSIDNFSIVNDSIGVIILKGSIWKFRLFSSTSGIDSNENDPELIKNIYPNPTLSTLNVEFNKELSYNDINKIKIIDVTGKSISFKIEQTNEKAININLDDKSPGRYILIYKNEHRLITIMK